MSKAVIEDWNAFYDYLSAQPLCKWSAQKREQLATGMVVVPVLSKPQNKNSNAELAAALAMMS
ncbi:MAG TPA: hypothetical protein VL968_04295 [Rhodocyclaceae bacterium]|jgi:hypothetical protein|nr:hypothetical protein [Rhodocyclaceae bacterium]